MQPIDLDLNQDPLDKLYDIDFASDGDFDMVAGFDTTIKMSILAERRAASSEVPDPLYRRGWIGNLFADEVGFEIGSKIWLYEQVRLNNSAINGVKGAALDGLQWLIDDAIAKEVSATIVPDRQTGRLTLTTNIEYSSGRVEQRFFTLWENTGL